MPWSNEPGQRIPEATRRRILRRDGGRCCECGQLGATQVDHRRPRHLGGTDDDSNLAAIHTRPCHQRKTQREAAAQRDTKARRLRAPEPHPGLRGGG